MKATKPSTWIQTYRNKQFDIFDLKDNDFDIVDIAHALSLLCRFNGHCNEFYSVAQHSVLMSKLVSKENALTALMHDAVEAYISDICEPIKRQVMVFDHVRQRSDQKFALDVYSIERLEDEVLSKVADQFGFKFLSKEIKIADLRMCATEVRDLLNGPLKDWGWLPEPYAQKIYPWNIDAGERLFLKRFEELVNVKLEV